MNFNLTIIALILICSSCATIVGGSRYNAHVNVLNSKTASISYYGNLQGYGSTILSVKRSASNSFAFAVQEEGCEIQTFSYNSRMFRGWSFVGSLLVWGVIVEGIPIPVGNIVDLASGAVWKPDIREQGIRKGDYKNFYYNVNYRGCKSEAPVSNPNYVKDESSSEEILKDADLLKFEKLRELKKLYDDGIISKEEFDLEKQKILN